MPEKFENKGEWDKESNQDDFEAHGLLCAMHRSDFGSWCGYVAISDNHPLYSQDFEGLELEVHGGLSYSGSYLKLNSGIPKKNAEALWWFGFDCSHNGDLIPYSPMHFKGDEYRNHKYAKTQCISLAKQLSNWSG